MIVRVGLDKNGDFAYKPEHLESVLYGEIQYEAQNAYVVFVQLSKDSWVIRPVYKNNLPIFFEFESEEDGIASSFAALS